MSIKSPVIRSVHTDDYILKRNHILQPGRDAEFRNGFEPDHTANHNTYLILIDHTFYWACEGNPHTDHYLQTIPDIMTTQLLEGSTMARVELNTRAPEFTLQDFHGNDVSLSDFGDQKNVLVVFNRGFA